MSQASLTRIPRPCLELGVCQNRKPMCKDCEGHPLRLAPGVIVIEGPYHRESQTRSLFGRLVAWLMGPIP